MITRFLYIKELPNGLKYLGTTIKDPFKYKGSGVYWKRVIKKYNYKIKDIKTIIIYETIDEEELKEKGLYYSALFNVVNDENWANLIPESGECSTIGCKPTKESIEKRMYKLSHKIIRIKDGKIYPSIKEAARDNNLYSSNLLHRLKLNDLTIGFKYFDAKLEEKAIKNKNDIFELQNNRQIKNIKKTSKHLGVSWDKEKRKWLSQIRINNKKVFLGRYDNENDACNAYQLKLEEFKNNKIDVVQIREEYGK